MNRSPFVSIPLVLLLTPAWGALAPRGALKAVGARAAQDEKSLTPEQSRVLTEALRLMTNSSASQEQGRLDEAVGLREQAQTLIEKTFGTEHPVASLNLKLLAFLYDQKGDYPKAEAAYLRALAAQEKLSGPEHAEVAGVLVGLGTVYGHMEDFVRAEQVYAR